MSILTLFIQSTEVIKPNTTSSKDPFGIGSDEDDNLFTSAPAVSKPPPSTQPAKAEEVTYTCIICSCYSNLLQSNCSYSMCIR